MAKTIVEIQALIDAQNLDARQLINLIVDYLQANPPGGGGSVPTLEDILDEDTSAGGNNITNLGTINGVKVYKALLTQSGTNAPVAIVLENTLGGTVVWSYSEVGMYRATLTGVFIENKVSFSQCGSSSATIISGEREDDNGIIITSFDVNDLQPTNARMNKTTIEIRVYP